MVVENFSAHSAHLSAAPNSISDPRPMPENTLWRCKQHVAG